MATISGTSGSDTLNGTSGNDTLSGLGANDTLVGSGGTDFYDGGTGTDTLDLRVGTVGITVSFAAGTISGGYSGTFTNIERVLSTNGADSLTGAAGNQTLSSRGGNDTLAGGTGTDTLWGGDGADSYVFRETGTANADSLADFASGLDKIVLDASVMTALGASGNFVAGDERFSANATGTADANDRIIFNTTTKQLFYDADGSGSGAAMLIATVQSTATVTATDITVVNGTAPGGGQSGGTAGNDSLVGTSGNDSIDGLGGNDTIHGLAGNDTLQGGAGADSMVGGSGDDLYIVDNAGDVTVEQADGGFDTVNASVSHTLAQFVNHLTLTGTASINGTGNEVGNVITGNSGNNWLDGGDGNDTLLGGAGFDRVSFTGNYGNDAADGGADEDQLYFADAVSAVTIDVASGRGTGGGTSGSGSINFVAFESVVGSAFADSITGGSNSDWLSGANGSDTVRGAAGNDSISGDGPFATAAGGADQLFGDDGNDLIIGGVGADLMDGGAGNDTFGLFDAGGVDGSYGSDTIDGGAGTDWLSLIVNGVRSDAQVDLGAGTLRGGGAGGEGSASLLNIENVEGDSWSESIKGSATANFLLGNAGQDTLDGAEGNDTLAGGSDADTFVFRETGTANADSISDFISGSVVTPPDIEADKIVLDASVMTELGASGNFAAGDARFVANTTGTAQDASDRIIYETDTRQVWYDADGTGAAASQLIATLQIGATLVATDIEVVNGTTAPPSGNVINGTSGNDTLTGTAGNDQINGLGGNDLFLAGSTGGADTIDGGEGRDSIEFKERATDAIQVDFVVGTITGASGTINFTNIERVVAGNFHDELTGNDASQTLTGQGGADTIWGAGGADTLWGGSGADNFLFREMGTANADRISDFATGADVLWLDDVAFTAIGPDGRFAAGDARFKANSSGTATDTNDRVVFNTSTGQLYYDADGSGGGAAQLIATVQSGATVAATDIVVI